MESDYIFEFRKTRELGAIINDTFAFVRQNWRDFIAKTWKLLLPYGAIILIYGIYYMISIENSMTDFQNTFELKGLINVYSNLALYGIIAMLCYAVLNLTVLTYLKQHIEFEGDVDADELQRSVYKRLFPMAILMILIGILVIIGFFFFIFPGIYFGIVLMFAPFILVFENKGISNSFSDSFSLLSGNWWPTFGSLIVITIIFSIMGYIFSIPGMLYTMASPFISDPEASGNIFIIFKDPVYLLLSTISMFGQIIISIISLIGISLVYFDLSEKKSFTGINKKIDDIGSEQ